jgi:hypothetical protein
MRFRRGLKILLPFVGAALADIVFKGPAANFFYDQIRGLPWVLALGGFLSGHLSALFTLVVMLVLLTACVYVFSKQLSTAADEEKKSEEDPIPLIDGVPWNFVGREAELAEVVQAVKNGVPSIALSGLPGVGKSTLAYKVVEEVRSLFPDLEVYVDLKIHAQAGDKPLTSREAMTHVLSRYNPKLVLNDDSSAIRSHYKKLFENRRALIVLDNAIDGDQIDEFLPPPRGCLVLITSLSYFSKPDMFSKRLDVLSVESARDLVCRIAPELGTTADEVTRLCGYLPLALRNVASWVAERPDQTTEIVDRLRDLKDKLELTGVELSLTLSSQMISSRLRNFWFELAVFPESFDRSAAAAIWSVDKNTARDNLSELLRHSLLGFNRVSRRYELHDLVRAFATSRLAGQPSSAQLRHSEYYRDVLADAEYTYQIGNMRGQVVSWSLTTEGAWDHFAVEWPNIEVGHLWAVNHAEESRCAGKLCVEYPYAGANLLWLRLHPWKKRIAWLEPAVLSAYRLEGGIWNRLTSSLRVLASPFNSRKPCSGITRHAELREYKCALRFLSRAIAVACQERPAIGAAAASATFRDQYPAFKGKLLKPSRELGYAKLADAFHKLALARLEVASKEEVVKRPIESGHEVSRMEDLCILSRQYRVLGETEKSNEVLQDCLSLARNTGERVWEANAQFESAKSFYDVGLLTRARAQAETALKIYEGCQSMQAADVEKWLIMMDDVK